MKKVLITGLNGLLGKHARAYFLAQNCAESFAGNPPKFNVIDLPRITEETRGSWVSHLADADVVLHLAGINRASDEELESGNEAIAELLQSALHEAKSNAHVIYANSTHSKADSPYGRGKQKAHIKLQTWANDTRGQYTNVVIPHVFGEMAVPNYNNVTATLCDNLINNKPPTIHAGARVELVHAGSIVENMLNYVISNITGTVEISGEKISVDSLFKTLQRFHNDMDNNIFPDLSDTFCTTLFNTLRCASYPQGFPHVLDLHVDSRGSLFEAVKGGGGGQTFLSWTEPGVERGNHFHRFKVERFLVLDGEASIKIRSIFSNSIEEFIVSGNNPAYIDMPTLHTHSIKNIGAGPLLTLFWTHEIFDRSNPDTFALNVDG